LSINELYEIARSGDKSAEEELFRTLSVRFRALAVQKVRDYDDCNDVVQNAVLAISREYKEIDIKTSFSAWAYKVLQNRILKYFNTNRRKTVNEESLSKFFVPPDTFKPDPTLESRLISCLKKISGVDIKYARILNLFYQGFSTRDVCLKLKIVPNHSYVILSRARSMLKLCLESGDIR
jgi:RNA polymerase sigma-70 factor (ECF subfamily)